MKDLTWSREVFIIDTPGEAAEYLLLVHPNDDDMVHDELSLSCACVPDYKIFLGPHGVGCTCVINRVVHHSLDGRELFE